ncbi:hypothetical protein ACS8Y6_05425 [Salinisphaera sp. RV14]|uniref:hypothetical protein n=1 Tax=Salinisphaera sp. RV14 TaxID=3454140 RepID=UPI003F87DE8C
MSVKEMVGGRDFSAGSRVQVLPDWRCESDGDNHLVRPSARFTPVRTEAFIQ